MDGRIMISFLPNILVASLLADVARGEIGALLKSPEDKYSDRFVYGEVNEVLEEVIQACYAAGIQSINTKGLIRGCEQIDRLYGPCAVVDRALQIVS